MVDPRFKRCRDKKRQTFIDLKEKTTTQEQRLAEARAEILELQTLLYKANEEKQQADRSVAQIYLYNQQLSSLNASLFNDLTNAQQQLQEAQGMIYFLQNQSAQFLSNL